MKKFGNVVLTIVMLCLIMLLCVNLSIKTMSTKAITNAVVVQEASNGIEEVLNQAFPDVSNENIKKVEEAVKNNSALNDVTSDLLDQITAAVANGSDVDTAAIAAQLSKAVDENIPAIEEAIGEKTLEQHLGEFDVLLLGPQVRYVIPNVKKILAGKIPFDVIDMRDYGLMNGEKVLAAALKMYDDFYNK